MKNKIKSDLMRVIYSRDFWFALLLLVATFIVSIAERFSEWEFHDMTWGIWFYAGTAGMMSFMPFVLPVAAALTGPVALCRDLDNRRSDYELARCDLKTYIFSKCIAHCLSAMAVMLLAGIICMIISIPLGWGSTVNPNRYPLAFEELYIASPIGYCAMIIAGDMLLMGVFALVATASAVLIKKPGAVLMVPFVLMMSIHLLFWNINNLRIFNWALIATPSSLETPSVITYLFQPIYGLAACRISLWALRKRVHI